MIILGAVVKFALRSVRARGVPTIVRSLGASPAMLLLDGVALTSSGRPVLAPEELELRILEKTDLEFPAPAFGGLPGAVAEKYVQGVAFLTTHRLLWLDQRALPAPGRSCGLPLSRVLEAAPVPLKMFGSRTRRHRVRCRGGVAGANDAGGDLKLAFRGEAPDAFARSLEEALARRAWLEDDDDDDHRRRLDHAPSNDRAVAPPSFPRHRRPPPPPSHPPLGPSADQARLRTERTLAPAARASAAGVSGAMNRRAEEERERTAALGAAFADMTALMAKAKEMVTLAEHFQRALDAKTRERSRSGGGGDDDDAAEMAEAVAAMGIKSPVTRESAGALFHQQLARQLADWLEPVLRSRGGILPLPDVFCLFNRARGSELVSPEDVLRACELWERLGCAPRSRRFESGVRVAQSPDLRDDEVCATLADALSAGAAEGGASGAGGRLDAFGAANVLGVAPTVAGEFLAMAEGHGIVCRDDGPDATWFYPNRFPEFAASG